MKRIYINWDNLPIHLDCIPTGLRLRATEVPVLTGRSIRAIPLSVRGAFNAVPMLAECSDVYLITTDTSKNSNIGKEKIALMEKYFCPGRFYKILTVNNLAELNQCDFFIDTFDSNIQGFHGQLFLIGGTRFSSLGDVAYCLLGYCFVNFQEDHFLKMIGSLGKHENEKEKAKEFVNILLSDCILKPIEEEFGKDDYYTNRLENMRELISEALIDHLLGWYGELISPCIGGRLSKRLDTYRNLIASRLLPEMKCKCCIWGYLFDDSLFNERVEIGWNENKDEIYVESCKLCGAYWIYYDRDCCFDYDLWYRAIIPPEELPSLTPENAIEYIENADFYIRGGTYPARISYGIGRIKEYLSHT
jgi:hypothetical protein